MPWTVMFADQFLRTLGLGTRPGWLLLISLALSPAWAGELEMISSLQQGGHVLMLRHAHAPGFGDPLQFLLGDCATQRNLDKAGRAQAAAVGDWLRDRGVEQARIYSSQWCRCLETASLLRLGPVTPLPALNSLFGQAHNREQNQRALREFLAGQPVDGPLLILVTHHVNIQAVTGFHVGSGEGVVLQLQPGNVPHVLGRLSFGS